MNRRKTKSRILRALGYFAVVAALYGYAFRLARVQGNSMEPTFHDNQWLLVRRLNWPAPALRQGEVVVFMQGKDMLVKRIAALPGQPFPTSMNRTRGERDTAAPRAPGAALGADAAQPPPVETPPTPGGNEPITVGSRLRAGNANDAAASRPERVPPGHLFVLGDNRGHSDDSRSFGPIPIASVLGRVLHWTRPSRRQ
jgi:signal peptidase I